ncbi:PH domain-containing protein [Modestobacter sp. I12A-02628]|uniref:PH domain-containing protein n=1 Tax=Goekera deserti TaxID=2497753 RepID=A0A7K3W8G7_9ACTN|nr:PH domain-containing protein [Goekera deserti]MPR00318.1 PH domain-containing protein [Goekera deserti]NDI49492.1 PH domain-containing protein [Goekera deserti]NEL52634.1 PH domain-containing protein [Goekera deserti]
MAYPDRILGPDEQVVRHLHPHWLTLFRPVVLFLVLVGGGSFGAALVPEGDDQALARLVIGAVAVVLGLVFVAVPLLRWRTTHYVITTHRLLFRTGILSRTGRDIGLSRITDVSYRQSLWDRVVNSGTLTIESAGDNGATVLSAIGHSEEVQQLLNHMIEEDADRRAQESAGYIGEAYRDDPYDDDHHPDDRSRGDRRDRRRTR